MSYNQVIISATSKREAETLSALLLKKRLIAGSLIIHGSSQYWWQRKIVKKTYYNIQAFTVSSKKKAITDHIRRRHADKAPIIAFIPIDGNTEFTQWISESTRSQTSNVTRQK